MTAKPEQVNLSKIRTDVAALVRAHLDEDVVAEYADAMQAEPAAIFPPVVLFQEGRTYWLADGRHRVEAARNAGMLCILSHVHSGTRADAEVYAAGANAEHGIQRSQEDKRLAVALFLSDPERAKLSDREIARQCRVSQPFVSKLRMQQIRDFMARAGAKRTDNVITPETANHPRTDATNLPAETPAPAKAPDHRPEPSPAPEPQIDGTVKEFVITLRQSFSGVNEMRAKLAFAHWCKTAPARTTALPHVCHFQAGARRGRVMTEWGGLKESGTEIALPKSGERENTRFPAHTRPTRKFTHARLMRLDPAGTHSIAPVALFNGPESIFRSWKFGRSVETQSLLLMNPAFMRFCGHERGYVRCVIKSWKPFQSQLEL